MRSCCWRTPTDQARLFKPFGQLKSGRKQGGTGLGLAISYRLVKALILSTAKTCDTDYTDVSLEGVEMMLSGISACLDIGDVSSLNDLAEQWSTNNKGLGHYPGQIKQSCGALDLAGLESIREELLGRLRAADRSREVNNDE